MVGNFFLSMQISRLADSNNSIVTCTRKGPCVKSLEAPVQLPQNLCRANEGEEIIYYTVGRSETAVIEVKLI